MVTSLTSHRAAAFRGLSATSTNLLMQESASLKRRSTVSRLASAHVAAVASLEPDVYPAVSKAAQVGFLRTRGVWISSFRGSRREGSSKLRGYPEQLCILLNVFQTSAVLHVSTCAMFGSSNEVHCVMCMHRAYSISIASKKVAYFWCPDTMWFASRCSNDSKLHLNALQFALELALPLFP